MRCLSSQYIVLVFTESSIFLTKAYKPSYRLHRLTLLTKNKRYHHCELADKGTREMKLTKCYLAVLVTTAYFITACGSGNSSTTTQPAPEPTTPPSTNLSQETLALGIEAVPSNLSATYSSSLNFNRYTKVDTPNGKAIHIVAQNQITDNQIVRARSILESYLMPYPGSVYGEDKSSVANKMSDNGAILLLLNGVDDGTNSAAELDGQPLYYGEMQVEGGQWYLQQDYEHRDASYEEILHLVHDYGIGVDQNNQFLGALPDFQAEIRAAQVNALSANIWGGNETSWINELTAENSLSQEYLAALIDVYYGLWGANTEFPNTGMYDIYQPKTRQDIATEDPLGASLIDNKFFLPYIAYNARIDQSFSGDFSLKFNANLPYTYHAQYLKDITLTGDNASNVIVNQYDNTITGNSASNIVIFSGNSAEYEITNEDDTTTVNDLVDNRDGKNTLKNVEQLRFADTDIEVSSL